MKKTIVLLLFVVTAVDTKMIKKMVNKEAIIKQLDKQLASSMDAQWNKVVDDLLFDLATVDRVMAREYSQKVREKMMSAVSQASKSSTKQPTKPVKPVKLEGSSPAKPVSVEKAVQKQSQQQSSEQMSSAMQGIIALQEFRKLTPSVFGTSIYVNGVLDKKWLAEALKLLLNGQPLTSIDKRNIQEELSGNATELVRELLDKDKSIPSNQWEKRLADVHNQVVNFVNDQLYAQEKHTSASSSTAPKHEKIVIMPSWISSKDNTFLLKQFEIEMLNYIFKKPNASKKEIGDYFVQQIPPALPTKPVIVQNIKDSVEKTFAKSKQEMPVESQGKKSSKTIPYWIIEKDKQVYVIDSKKFADALYQAMADEKNSLHTAMAKKGVDVDKVIVEYFVSQLPKNISNKASIIEQIQFELELYWLNAGK